MAELYELEYGRAVSPWRKWFAWKPVDTVDCGWIWFKTVNRRRIQKHDYLPGDTEQWWQYVKILEED